MYPCTHMHTHTPHTHTYTHMHTHTPHTHAHTHTPHTHAHTHTTYTCTHTHTTYTCTQSFKRSPVYFNLLNTSDADINTPLHLAAKNGNVDTVKYLLSLKDGSGKFLVNRNPRNVIYQTPMHQAAKNGHAK